MCALACAVLAVGLAGVAKSRGWVYRESIWCIDIYVGDDPLSLRDATPGRLAIRPTHVTDARARFVADPFMIRASGGWHMFFEVLNADTNQGDIGLATSENGVDWQYERIVLDEPFHLSYPHVFEIDGDYYMLPETSEAGEIRLYRATHFPHSWQLDTVLLEGPYADPSLLRHDGGWWMFASPEPRANARLSLFSAPALRGPWSAVTEIYEDHADRARCAGVPFALNGRLYRLAQDCASRYGFSASAYEISSLSPNYTETAVLDAPIIRGNGSGWNAFGMHHIDAHRTSDGTWIACVDGYRKRLRVRIPILQSPR